MKVLQRFWVACAAGLSVAAGIARAEERPNIILMMADDVSWECFSCYGADDYETPAIDRLAAQGVRFEHCYSTPICTPSRVMIMSGKHSFRNYTHFTYMGPAEKTFGNLFQDAGYKTAIAGKWQREACNESTGLSRLEVAKIRDAVGNDSSLPSYVCWRREFWKNRTLDLFWHDVLDDAGRI